MNNSLVLDEKLSDEIVKSLIDGTITEAEQGLLVKKIQVAMGSNLLKTITSITSQYERLDTAINTVLTQLEARLTDIDVSLQTRELLEMYDKLSSIQARSAELTRKVAQGKPLFDFPILSEEERTVASLMASFSSQEEKKEFYQLVTNWMNSRNHE